MSHTGPGAPYTVAAPLDTAPRLPFILLTSVFSSAYSVQVAPRRSFWTTDIVRFSTAKR